MRSKAGIHALGFLICLMFFLHLLPYFSTGAGPDQDWPFGGRDPGRRNFAEFEKVLEPPLVLKWSANVSRTLISAFTVGDGKLFAAVDADDRPCRAVCLDAASGRQLWSHEIAGSGGTMGCSPAYYQGRVYVGAQSTRMLEALDANTGVLIWSLDVGDMFMSAPIVVDGLLYCRAGVTLYVIDPVTRTIKWKREGIYSDPAFYGGLLFISDLATNSLMAFDKTNGEFKWNKPIGTVQTYSYCPALVSGQTVFVSSKEGDARVVWALSTIDGTQKWKATIDNNFYPVSKGSGFMAEANGILYAAVMNMTTKPPIKYNGKVLAFDSAKGTLLWRFERDGSMLSAPTIANGIVYVASFHEMKLFALSGDRGQELWQYEVGFASAQPIVSNGMLYTTGWGQAMAFATGPVKVTISSPAGKVMVDGLTYAASELPMAFSWTRGSTHTLTANKMIEYGNGTRHQFLGWYQAGALLSGLTEILFAAKEPTTLVARWTTEHQVKVSSEFGKASGDGWYSSGTSASVSVAPTVIEGFFTNTVFEGWKADGKVISTSSLYTFVVSQPISLSATWRSEPNLILLGGIGGIIVVGLVLVLLLRRQRPRGEPLPPPPPPQ